MKLWLIFTMAVKSGIKCMHAYISMWVIWIVSIVSLVHRGELREAIEAKSDKPVAQITTVCITCELTTLHKR